MKRYFLFYLFLFSSISAFSQQWSPYKIDDSVQVLLPKGAVRKDTLGQIIITATSAFGNVMIIKTPDNPKSTPDIEKERHLKQYYSDYLKRISSSSEGIVSEERDTTIFNLTVKDFKLAVDSGRGKQIRHFRILHENGATYTFQFLNQDIHQESAESEKEKFFNSIKITEPTKASQFTDPDNTTGKTPRGNRTLMIIAGSAIALIIVFIVVFSRLRKRKRNL